MKALSDRRGHFERNNPIIVMAALKSDLK